MLDHLFHLNTPVLEKIVRPVVVYFAIILLLRVFGKRELAQLNPFDLVVLLSVSNTVQNAIIGEDNSVTGGLLGAVSLFVINYPVSAPAVGRDHGGLADVSGREWPRGSQGAGEGIIDRGGPEFSRAPAGVRWFGGSGNVHA